MAKFDFIYQHSLFLGWYTNSSTSLTIRCNFCETICLWPQNTPQFPISLLHWTRIFSPGAFSWSLQTASSHWGPDLENRVDAEANWSTIHVLPSFRSTYDMPHCLAERVLFSSSFLTVVFFLQFLNSNAPLMLYSIRYWWFFFLR